MKKLVLLIIIGSSFLTSCSDMDNKVKGIWIIKEIYQNNESIFDTLFSTGVLINKNKTCDLPIRSIEDRNTSKKIGQWEVIKKGEDNYYLKITTDNELFNDSYKIKVWERVLDENSQAYGIRMILESDRTTIVLTRSDY